MILLTGLQKSLGKSQCPPWIKLIKLLIWKKKKAHYDKGHVQKNKSFKKLLNIIFNGETLSICSLKYRRIARMSPLIKHWNKISPSAIRQERKSIILLRKREEKFIHKWLNCLYIWWELARLQKSTT